MAYIALLGEKLQPALVNLSSVCFLTNTNLWVLLMFRVLFCVPQLHTFWVDAENYANLTRPWFASRSPFPLNFLVPYRHASAALSRILLTKGEAPLHRITEVEGKVDTDLSNSSVTCCVSSVNMLTHCGCECRVLFFTTVNLAHSVCLRSTVMLKSAWISSPTDWEQQTTSLAICEFF